MLLQEAQDFVDDHQFALLKMLAQQRLAVYHHSRAYRLPSETRDEARAAADAQRRAGITIDAVQANLHSLLTTGIDHLIDQQEAEAKEARSEADGTER